MSKNQRTASEKPKMKAKTGKAVCPNNQDGRVDCKIEMMGKNSRTIRIDRGISIDPPNGSDERRQVPPKMKDHIPRALNFRMRENGKVLKTGPG